MCIPSLDLITASSQFHASRFTIEDLPEIIPPRGVICAIKTPFGRIVSTTLDSVL